MQMAREEPYQVLSNDLIGSKEELEKKRKEERRGGGEKEDNGAAISKQSKMRRLVGVSLW